VLHTQQEAGTADAADQNRDFHVTDIRRWRRAASNRWRVWATRQSATRRFRVTKWY